MNRQELDELLVDYLYDELDAATTRRVEAALPDHPELMEEVDAHRSVRAMMGEVADVPVPDGLLDGVMAEAREVAAAAHKDRESLWDRVFGWMMLPGVAVALVFILVGSMGWFLSYSDEEPSTAPVSGVVFAEKMTETPPTTEAAAGVGQGWEAGESPTPAAGEAESNVPAEDAAPGEVAAAQVNSALEAEEDLRPVAEGVVAKLVSAQPPAAPTKESSYGIDTADDPLDLALAEADMKAAKRRLRSKVAPKYRGGNEQRLWEARKGANKKSQKSRSAKGEQVADARLVRPAVARADHVSNAFGRAALPEAPPRSAPYQANREEGSAPSVAPEPPAEEKASTKGNSWTDEAKRIREMKTTDGRAKAWIKAFEGYLRSGRKDLARRALKALEAEPGWADAAAARRRAMEGKGKGGAPTGPVPAAAEGEEAPVAPED